MSKKRNTAKKMAKVTGQVEQAAHRESLVKLYWLWLWHPLYPRLDRCRWLPPEIEELENLIDKYASQVITSDNQLLFTYSLSDENRIFVDYMDLSPHLINALVSTEDIRYYLHSGIDVIGLGRAMFKTIILNQKGGGGGSTITQQLAKLLYSPRANNKIQRAFQKPIEWVIAAKLERYYSKMRSSIST